MVIEQEITEMVAKITETTPETLNPEASFIEDMNLDSLRALEILAALENRYHITIEQEKLRDMTNLNAVIKIAKEYIK
jgi:acyl carrier protein